MLGNQMGIVIGMSLGGVLVAQWGYGMLGFLCAAAVGGSVFYRFAVREPAIARSSEYFSDADLKGK